MSTTPEQALVAAEVFCESRIPERLREEIRLECSRRGRSVTIVERRPPWREDLGPEWTSVTVAQLRFDEDSGRWSLHWRDSSERWHLYDRVGPSPSVDPLLAEIDADPTGVFWG